MAGEKERVADSETAQNEAAEDAKLIKEGDPSKTSYQLFKDEVESMEREGVDEGLRREYRIALKKELGDEMDRVVIDFLSDKDSDRLKSKDGTFTPQKFGGLYSDEASDLDRTILPEVMLRFDDLAAANKRDGQGGYGNAVGITARDVDSFTAAQQKRDDMAKFAEANKEAGIGTLLDPKFALNWDKIDVENQIFKGRDGKASKQGIDDYLARADRAEGREKDRYPADFIDKLRKLSDDWDTPEIKALTEKGQGRLISLESIAKGLGYKSLDSYRESGPAVEKETASASAESETKTMTRKYEGGAVERAYTFDADKKLTAFTETRDGKTTSYKVEPEHGEATNTETGESFGRVHVDSITGNVTIHETGKDEVMVKPDAAPQQETVLQKDLKIEDLSAAATQQAGQGYWQVAEKVLEATKNAETNPDDTRAQNIVLMRALQMQHRQQGGHLGQHKFIANQTDLAKLNENIDAYINENPSFAKYKESLHKRLQMVKAVS